MSARLSVVQLVMLLAMHFSQALDRSVLRDEVEEGVDEGIGFALPHIAGPVVMENPHHFEHDPELSATPVVRRISGT